MLVSVYVYVENVVRNPVVEEVKDVVVVVVVVFASEVIVVDLERYG